MNAQQNLSQSMLDASKLDLETIRKVREIKEAALRRCKTRMQDLTDMETLTNKKVSALQTELATFRKQERTSIQEELDKTLETIGETPISIDIAKDIVINSTVKPVAKAAGFFGGLVKNGVDKLGSFAKEGYEKARQ